MFVNSEWMESMDEWDDEYLSSSDWLGLVHTGADTDWYKEVTR